jgi:hypothetical protein
MRLPFPWILPSDPFDEVFRDDSVEMCNIHALVAIEKHFNVSLITAAANFVTAKDIAIAISERRSDKGM